jgi:hypothetical protein
MTTSKLHDDDRNRGSTGLGTTSVAVPAMEATGCLPGVLTASAGMGGTHRTHVVPDVPKRQGPWPCRSGEPLCLADDIDTAAEKIAHVLAPQGDRGVMGIRRQAGA